MYKFFYFHFFQSNNLLIVKQKNYLNWLLMKINFYLNYHKKIYFFFDNLFLSDINIIHFFFFNKSLFFHYFWFFNFEKYLLRKKKWYLYFIKLFKILKINFIFFQSQLYNLFKSIQKFKFLLYFQNIYIINLNLDIYKYYYFIWYFLQLTKLLIFNFLKYQQKYFISIFFNKTFLIN